MLVMDMPPMAVELRVGATEYREVSPVLQQRPKLQLAAAGEVSTSGGSKSDDHRTAAPSTTSYDIKLKVCGDVVGPNTKYRPDDYGSINVISPLTDVVTRIYRPTSEEENLPASPVYKQRMAELRRDAVITVVQQPKHGKLLPVKSGTNNGYFYLANRGYFGKDKAVFSVKLNDGRTVQLERGISVIETLPSGDPCSTTEKEFRDLLKRDWDEFKRDWDTRNISRNEVAPILDKGILKEGFAASGRMDLRTSAAAFFRY